MLDLFFAFLKIGTLSFGGGYGMISLLQDEVLSHGWLAEEDFLNFIAVSESTPGPLAVNMATFIGSSQGGAPGAFLATVGVVLPSFFIILLIAAVLNNLLKYKPVNAFLDGLRPCVAALILGTAVTMTAVLVACAAHFYRKNNHLRFRNHFSLADLRETLAASLACMAEKTLAELCACLEGEGFHTVAGGAFAFKKLRKKAISPILLIVISAGLGMLFFGVIG